MIKTPMRCMPYPIRLLATPALAMLFGQPFIAHGQAVPNAGQILRELRQPANPGIIPQPRATVEGEPVPPSPQDDISVTVTAFEISGNTVVSNNDLQDLLADLQGRRLSLAELKGATGRITSLYRARGYPVARAYLPAQ